jgi:hypothetical protein
MSARGAGLVAPILTLLRGLRLPQRRPPSACPRCATPVRAGLSACPLCGEVVPAALESRLATWRRRGLLEVTVISVVLLVFLVCFLVVFSHR